MDFPVSLDLSPVTAMTESEHEVHDHTKVYLAVFVCLLVLTCVTVTISRMHLARPLAISIGLTIATIKGSLVAAYFMHMISERTIIRSVVGLSLAGLFFLVMLPWMDLTKSFGVSTQTAAVETAGHGHHQ